MDSSSSSNTATSSKNSDTKSGEMSEITRDLDNLSMLDNDRSNSDNNVPSRIHKYACGHVIPFRCFGDEFFTRQPCKQCSWRKVFDVMRETRRNMKSRFELMQREIADIRTIQRDLARYYEVPRGFFARVEYKRWELMYQMRVNQVAASASMGDFMQDWINRFGETTKAEMDSWEEWLREAVAEDEAETEAEAERRTGS